MQMHGERSGIESLEARGYLGKNEAPHVGRILSIPGPLSLSLPSSLPPPLIVLSSHGLSFCQIYNP